MDYCIKNYTFLKKILWLDAIMGGLTAIIGLVFVLPLSVFLGLPNNLLTIISIITLMYAPVATFLAMQKSISIPVLRLLIKANWLWAMVSLVLVFMYFNEAKVTGIIFLMLNVLVVGTLAYLEGNQILKNSSF